MASTKIINILKDDKFEELLDIVKKSDASEVIFVLPKKNKAFKSEVQFASLNKEAENSGKRITFMCSDPEIAELVKKHNFEIILTKSKTPSKYSYAKKPAAVPAIAKSGDLDDESDNDEDYGDIKDSEPSDEDKWGEHHPMSEKKHREKKVESSDQDQTDEDYKEEQVEEDDGSEYEPPYGTELDESGDPIYEEDRDSVSEFMSARNGKDFKVIPAGAKTRGMSDVIKPGGRNLKVANKDRGHIKLETRKYEEENISNFGWKNKTSDSIWTDVPKTNFFKPSKSYKNLHKKLFRGWKSITAVGIILIVLLLALFVAGSAKVEIKPKAQELNSQFKVVMSPEFSSIDKSMNRIPGQAFSINKSVSDKFNATSEKDAIQKARGSITVYNEYSTSPQSLVATTRFENLDDGKETGLVFRTLQTVIVPGMKVENGVITPGKIKVDVIADKPGQNYNIPAGNFGIMAWREKNDTAKYQKLYGKSSDPMHGGILGKAKVVSEFDYNNAKDLLVEKVKKEIQDSLKSQSAGLETLSVIEPKTESVKSTAEIGDAAEMFTVSVNSSLTTMGFKKADLLALISEYIGNTKNLTVVPEKITLGYKNPVFDQNSNRMEITIVIGGKGYTKIDKNVLISDLSGKNETQIKNYITSNKNIDSAKVFFKPFWVSRVPKNKEKIDILFTY